MASKIVSLSLLVMMAIGSMSCSSWRKEECYDMAPLICRRAEQRPLCCPTPHFWGNECCGSN